MTSSLKVTLKSSRGCEAKRGGGGPVDVYVARSAAPDNTHPIRVLLACTEHKNTGLADAGGQPTKGPCQRRRVARQCRLNRVSMIAQVAMALAAVVNGPHSA